MPMDRRIAVSFTTTTYQRGQAVPTTTTRQVWATKLQDAVARVPDASGTRSDASRAYRIRYWKDLVTAIEAGETVTVLDPDVSTEALVVGSIGEPEGTRRQPGPRRRFLDLLIR